MCELNGALLKECNSWGNSAGLVTWAFLWFGPCGLPRERGYNKMRVKLKRAVFLKTLLRAVFNSICNNGSWRWEGQGGVASGPPVVSTERKVNSERGRGSEREKGWGKGDRDRDRDKETEAEKGETDRRDRDSGDRDGT